MASEKKGELTLEAIKAAAEIAARKALSEKRSDEESEVKRRSAEQKRQEQDAQINDMSRAEFANMIFERITEHLTGAIGDTFKKMTATYDDRFKALDEIVVDRRIAEAKNEKYFEEFRGDIAEKLRERPELTPLEAFRLVKAEMPDKVKELSDAEAAKAREAEEKSTPKKFGGFFPTNGSVAAKSTEKMDSKTAAEAAWQATMAEVPKALFEGELV